MPDGSSNRVAVRLSEVVPFIVMKGMALYDRLKEKDAWDIYFCIQHFSGGIPALAEEFRQLLPDRLVEEGLAKIRSKFSDINAIGPGYVVAFEEISDPDEAARLRRDAFERVTALLDLLDVIDYQGPPATA
jgi:hypothetical protein